jgi:hypothetical protein
MAKNNVREINNKGGIEDLTQASFAQNGMRIIDESYIADPEERFFCLLPVLDSVMSCDSNAAGGDASISALEMVAGLNIFGVFSNVSVAAGGKVIGYLI